MRIQKLTCENVSLKDVQKQLGEARQGAQKTKVQNQSLHKAIKGQNEYIQQVEEKMYKANVSSLNVLKELRNAEQEIETLKNYVIQLKSKVALYLPQKDDAVDLKLADFINNYPERQKLKIMFMRESEGVYTFGSRKIFIKIEKNKIKSKFLPFFGFHIMNNPFFLYSIVRVAGGFLSIDEFLDQYTPEELAKLERRDPLKKFSQKVAV